MRLFVGLIAISMVGAAAIAAIENGPPPEGAWHGPPPAALAACRAVNAGATCHFVDRERSLAGHCLAPPGRALACRPDGAGRPDPPPPPDATTGGGGAPVPSSRVATDGIGCNVQHDAPNAGLGLVSQYRWHCADGQRVLDANGIPAHAVGAFPNPGNPNQISVQHVSVALPLMAMAYSGSGWHVKVPGYALDGVRFDPGTAETCTADCGNGGHGRGGEWRIEALHQDFFDFGVDADNAHVQPGGAYHYHGIPAALLAGGGKTAAMTLIGWAVDGYPIYGRWGHDIATDPASALRPMRSSYRLKARPDAGRPPLAMVPMGTFTQDYEYVAGLGDLDACNGRRDVTPAFPRGAYHYYATDAYPYVQRCVMGKPARGAGQEPPPPWGRLW